MTPFISSSFSYHPPKHSAIANPTDLVKIRMQAYHSGPPPYRSMRHAFSSIYHESPSGIRSLYRGVFPTVARGWAVAACQMPAYDHTKQYLKKNSLLQEGIGAHLAASLVAGSVFFVFAAVGRLIGLS